MSTGWGYRCDSHNPPLLSEMFVYQEQHNNLQLALEFREGVLKADDLFEQVDSGYPSSTWIYWLKQHPNCDVSVVNEYGETRDEYLAKRKTPVEVDLDYLNMRTKER